MDNYKFFSLEIFRDYLKKVKFDYYHRHETLYPFDFEDYWRMFFSNKKSAINHLETHFFEHHDYIKMDSTIYLTPICFEFMFMRKELRLFDAYRHIWHNDGVMIFIPNGADFDESLSQWINQYNEVKIEKTTG